MAIGFGPGSDMMKSYQENRKQMKSRSALNDIHKTYKKPMKDQVKADHAIKDSNESGLSCPTCQSNYTTEVENCLKCGYPFTGTEKEKSVFIGRQIVKKGKISETRDSIKVARMVLWAIGVINLVFAIINYTKGIEFRFDFYASLIIAMTFLAFGLLTYKKPLFSILTPLILISLYYVLLGFIDLSLIWTGIIWKIAILSSLVITVRNIIRSNRLKRESDFMNEQ